MHASDIILLIAGLGMLATLASSTALDGIVAGDVTVTGRSAIIPDPLNASWSALAFDFNGVSINASVPESTSTKYIQRIQVALTEACYKLPNGSWSRSSHAAHRLRLYVAADGSNDLWAEPTGALLVDTHNTECNTLQWYTIFEGILQTPFQFSLFHLTEADWNAANATQPNYLLFHQYRLYGSAQTAEVPTPRFVFRTGAKSLGSPKGQQRRRRIEFIGDSITAGYCNTCNLFPNQSNTYALQDFSYSWAHLTCAQFNADCHTEAWSGRGVIRNCDDEAPVWMPTIVRRAVGSVSEFDDFWGVTNTWDFESFIPDAIVVNLGTNDYGCHPIPNITQFNDEFEQAYVNMLTMLLRGYRNETQGVFLACGPMSSAYCDAVHSIIAKMQQLGWDHVYFLNHVGLLPSSEQCCGHPDTIADGTIAGVTVSTIQAALGWN